MSEEIPIDYASMKIMSPDALDFFVDEIVSGNTIRITGCPEDGSIVVTTRRDWNEALDRLKIHLPEEPKKNYRI